MLRLVEVELLLELIYTTTTVDVLLLSGKERMASGANVQSHFFLSGLGHESVTASAYYLAVYVLRMDSLLHSGFTSFLFINSRYISILGTESPQDSLAY